jgi:phosphoribosylaminoimidazolecarboxamide formyltransferase / IMP cyclohydrolase
MEANGNVITDNIRLLLAWKVFNRISMYDACIAGFLRHQMEKTNVSIESESPQDIHLALKHVKNLRYGENPHQKASVYHNVFSKTKGLLSSDQLSGKEISFNNLLDLDAAWKLVTAFDTPAAVIVKHQNPCGAAVAHDLSTAYARALECDPVSAYGGIAAVNGVIDVDTAELLHKTPFLEIIAAVDFMADALTILKAKKNRRLMKMNLTPAAEKQLEFRIFEDGALVQEEDFFLEKPENFIQVTRRIPNCDEMEDLIFAWKVCRFVKSNAIVFAKNLATLGIGAGQVSRVDSVLIAARKAGNHASGAVMASDAFFPFPDGIEAAASAGIRAVIQPGGSKNDQDVIAVCDRFDLAMVFTQVRHFRH